MPMVANGGGQILDFVNVTRLGDDGADKKRAKGHGVAEHRGQERHGKAEPERGDQKHFVAFEFRDVVEHPRHEDESRHQDHGEKDGELEDLHADLRGVERSGAGKPGKDREEDDGKHVFDHENAEDDFCEGLARFAQLGQRFDDDGGGGDGEHCSEENAVHRTPSKRAADLVTEPDHQRDFQQRGDERGQADPAELADIELQPEGEHEQDDAHLAEGFHGLLVAHQHERRRVGSNDEAGHDVADDDRLLEAMAEDRGDPGDQHDDGEIVKEIDVVHRANCSDALEALHLKKRLETARYSEFREDLFAGMESAAPPGADPSTGSG
jgi:hypothetical protein